MLAGFGNSLFVSEGDFWLRQRRLMQPHFHRQRLAALTEVMATAIDEVLASWEPAVSAAGPFDLPPAFDQLTMKVILRTMLGTALTNHELDQVGEAVSCMIDFMLLGAISKGLPAWVPLPGLKRYQEALATFNATIYRISAAHRQGHASDNHMLAMFLDSVDAQTGERMDERQIRDEVATLFLAGYETTSVMLAWVTYYLSRHPAALQKLQAEADTLLGGRQPTFADLPNLTYARMVLQETPRLRPPSGWMPRSLSPSDRFFF